MSPLTHYWWSGQQQFIIGIQLNFSSMATLGTEESGHCKEVDVVKRFNPLTAIFKFFGSISLFNMDDLLTSNFPVFSASRS